jgi:hypothetical protein
LAASSNRIVSIPFSSGQWMKLTKEGGKAWDIDGFNPLFIGSMNEADWSDLRIRCFSLCFNPLFIGSMNEAVNLINANLRGAKFQSPFHRVNEWSESSAIGQLGIFLVSIPFSSGQWMKHR